MDLSAMYFIISLVPRPPLTTFFHGSEKCCKGRLGYEATLLYL